MVTQLAISSALTAVLDRFCCPVCRSRDEVDSALDESADALTCTRCGERYPIEDGIPVFLPAPIRRANLEPDADEEARQKWQQRQWHDQHQLVEWNINDPHHAPLKEYCLYRQMGAAADLMPRSLKPTAILNVCCGSGLEAEFFAQHYGLPVIGTDISIGMLRNAVARAARAGYRFVAVCADSENLPFRRDSVDLAIVLHGLHHLPSPARGLREMARVSAHGLCVFEPATSPIRELMMRLGFVSRIEESGNVSFDFSEDSRFSELLGESGFDHVVYRRELWSLFVSELRLANLWPVRFVAERMFDLLHAGAGRRWGTKLTMVAWRSAPGAHPLSA